MGRFRIKFTHSGGTWHRKIWAMGLGLIASTLSVQADAPKLSYTTTLGYERGAQIIGGVNATKASFEMTPYVLTQVQTMRSVSDNASLTYGANFGLTGNATALGETLFELGAEISYKKKFGDENRFQYRLKAEIENAASQSDWVFQRARLGVDVKYRAGPMHTTAVLLRYSVRDQNDTHFSGFDQQEYVAQLSHTWRPNKDRMAVSGTLYRESRDAEADRFSYDEVGLRAMFRIPVSKELEVTARASSYLRNYHDAFSATTLDFRKDRRLKATFEVTRDLGDTYSGAIYAGWDINQSNIADRDYSGAIVGLNITRSWN